MVTFDERARDWDTPEHIERSRAIAALILDTVRPSPTTRVLELGAGTGLLGLSLLPHVAEVVLTDASGGMLEVADAKIATGAHPGARTLPFTIAEDAVPEDRFDLIVSMMALHHVLDTTAAIEAMATLLVRGGQIALVDLEAEDGTFHTDPPGPVLHGFERDDLQASLEAAGFQDVAFRPASEVMREERAYPLFLVTATRS
jgi:2-polyprenyl-3-methyl-5-hydroxy-6-metoxy-1,4-benzoquinol methylase